MPTLLDPKIQSKNIVKDTAAAAAEEDTPGLSPKTMWITMRSDQSTSMDSNNKKSIDPHLEPIEETSESNQIKDSTAKSDPKNMETVTTEKETSVEKSAGERLIPTEIPRIISWADLGLEPSDLGLEPLDLGLGLEPLRLSNVKIGPLTETDQWSEKRDDNSFQEAEPQNKILEVAENFPGKDGETAEKVRNY